MRLQDRKLAVAIGFLAVAIVSRGFAAHGEERTPVALRVANGTENAVLRCQLVLAHFMTGDLAPARPGLVIDIDLMREAATSTLLYLGPGGRLVAVENVLCGANGDWAATRNDIDLTALRDGRTQQLRMICADRGGLSCTADEKKRD